MPTDETRNALPVERVFIVRLHPGALPEMGRVAGRVEHSRVRSERAFRSLPELLVFLGRRAEEPGTRRRAGRKPAREAR